MNDDEIAEQRAQLLDGWQESAPGWGRQADRVRATAMPVSSWMLAHADLRPGMRVLELAAGPGDTGLLAAGRIAPGGVLICSDGVQEMLDVARERAREQGVENVEFRQLQLEWIDMPAAVLDVVLCRWGVMLTVDPAAALQECRRVLKPGGRLCVAVWDAPERNPWVTVADAAISALGHTDGPARAGPGMFALAQEGKLEQLLVEAGFLEIVVEPVAIAYEYSSVSDYIGQTRDLSRGFRRVWDGLADGQRRELRGKLEELTRPHLRADGAIVLAGSSLAAAADA